MLTLVRSLVVEANHMISSSSNLASALVSSTSTLPALAVKSTSAAVPRVKMEAGLSLLKASKMACTSAFPLSVKEGIVNEQ